MARYYKRRRYNRRRRRRNGRKSLGFKILKKSSQLVHGQRRFWEETRNEALECPENKVLWTCMEGVGGRAQIEAIINKVGDVHTGLGEVANLNPYSTHPLNHRVDITKWKRVYNFVNVDKIPAFITIYTIGAKRDAAGEAVGNGAMQDDVIESLEGGWKRYQPTGSSSATEVIGDSMIGTASSGALEVESKFLHPKQSPNFNSMFKILRRKSYKLEPGDNITWKVFAKNRVYNPEHWHNPHDAENGASASSYETIDWKKNYTKVVLVKTHGVIGRSNATGEADLIAQLQCDVAYSLIESCFIAPLVSYQPDHYGSVVKDDVTGKTFEHPTEHTMTEDDP